MISPRLACVSTGIILFIAGTASAVDPNPLESAYWRFEEGTAGTKVPEGNNTVLDYINSNHMRRFTNEDPWPPDVNAPTYSTDVPGSVVPATGQPNSLSLWFSGSFQDVYTEGKNIQNPIVTAFTLEASFKSEVVGEGLWQAVVSKESNSDDFSSDAPPLSLKITGDGNNRLRIELRDKANNLRLIDSTAVIVANQWYHAAVVATDTELKLYLDENNGEGYVLQGTDAIAGGGPLWEGTNPGVDGDGYNSVWNIGKGMWARQITDFFGGVIDEVRLTNQALDPSEFLWFEIPLPGDFNNDGRVDGADFELFRQCATGADVPYQPTLPPGCTMTLENGFIPADLDKDGDVDMDDFAIFQANYTG